MIRLSSSIIYLVCFTSVDFSCLSWLQQGSELMIVPLAANSKRYQVIFQNPRYVIIIESYQPIIVPGHRVEELSPKQLSQKLKKYSRSKILNLKLSNN